MTSGALPGVRTALLVGLFCTTASTLAIELLDTRLLSVITWYHLSFLALSLAMLGMAAGAVHVFLGGEAYSEARAPEQLARWSAYFAASVLGTHLLALTIPILPETGGANVTLSVMTLTVVLCVPFVLSGIVVSIALTRIPGKVGLIYSVDLIGAALGSLAVLALLTWADLTTAMELSAVLAALGAVSFAVYAGRSPTSPALLAALALALGLAQWSGVVRLRVPSSKGRGLVVEDVESEHWSLHGQVMVYNRSSGPPFYWAAGDGAPEEPVDRMRMVIDGMAATWVTRWDGQPGSLDWVSYDVTALPYHLIKGGEVAVIGVGGGRDVLSALWADSRHVTGLELNRSFLDLHRRLDTFSGIARDPRVTLVNDEARSWLTRTDQRFDVIQMSLIDTWAATGAGAFTLSENGLYTEEAFTMMLERLDTDGLLSVSRWYAPGALSETSRLVSLATAGLLAAGVEDPRRHMVMATRHKLATLILSRSPLTERQLATIDEVSDRYGYELPLTPHTASDELISAIASSRGRDGLLSAVADVPLDLSPPTDDRPYFFNLILPGRRPPAQMADGVVAGNLLATSVLSMTVSSSMVVLLGLVVLPLVRHGRPGTMSRAVFGTSVVYFALIGAGYMLVQVGFLQRLSPYLGEPIYAVAIVLFSMILSSGLGAAASDAVDPHRSPALRIGVALSTCAGLLAALWLLPPLMRGTTSMGLPIRATVALVAVAPVSFLLGFHFPLGMRAVQRVSAAATPWMWGVNGAAAVVASGTAVIVSMWFGISATQALGALCYLLLAAASAKLWAAEAA
jgi:hypothetical protein